MGAGRGVAHGVVRPEAEFRAQGFDVLPLGVRNDWAIEVAALQPLQISFAPFAFKLDQAALRRAELLALDPDQSRAAVEDFGQLSEQAQLTRSDAIQSPE